MFKRMLHFIKYNNATVFILAIIILGGAGAFAQTETGQAMIGEKFTNIEGIDNTLLIEADFDNFDADYKIERIEKDPPSKVSGGKHGYYYITYTYLDLVKMNSAWQYQIQEKIRKVSKKLKKDIGAYIAEELEEQHYARIKDLKLEKEKAEETTGKETRLEVIEYSGLIGQTLDLGSRIFPGYNPVKMRDIPSPSIPPAVLLARTKGESTDDTADSLTDVYNDYIERMDPDGDEIFGIIDNCPAVFNPAQADTDDDGLGNLCDPEPLAPKDAAVAGVALPEPEILEDNTVASAEIIDEGIASTTDEASVSELIDEIVGNTEEDAGIAEEIPPAAEENIAEPTEEEAVVAAEEPEVEIVELP